MHIFLISGKAQSGKNATADILIDKLKGKSITIAMADYLKFMATKYYNWNGEKDVRGRTLLQDLGTDRIREELKWETFHVERVCQDIKIIEDDYDYVFVPDCRFRNEILYTQAMFPYNTTTIRVNRKNLQSNLTKKQQQHRSEIELDDFKYDYTLFVDEGLDKLENEIDFKLGGLIKYINNKKGGN